jgi:hypothetical protein
VKGRVSLKLGSEKAKKTLWECGSDMNFQHFWRPTLHSRGTQNRCDGCAHRGDAHNSFQKVLSQFEIQQQHHNIFVGISQNNNKQ